jgi:hypothetical protein
MICAYGNYKQVEVSIKYFGVTEESLYVSYRTAQDYSLKIHATYLHKHLKPQIFVLCGFFWHVAGLHSFDWASAYVFQKHSCVNSNIA